jgi:hypothetical protein
MEAIFSMRAWPDGSNFKTESEIWRDIPTTVAR